MKDIFSIKALIIPAAVMLSALLALPAFGQYQRRMDIRKPMLRQDWPESQMQGQCPFVQEQPILQLQGPITDVRNIDIIDTGQQHLLAKVRSDYSGRIFVVDLGPAQELRDIDLRRGRTITVLGVPYPASQYPCGSFQHSIIIVL